MFPLFFVIFIQKQKHKMQVSFFKGGITVKDNPETLSFNDICSRISNGDYSNTVAIVRGKDIVASKKAKKSLDYFTPAGIFSSRNNSSLLNYSGVIGIDIDGIKSEDSIRQLCERLRDDRYVMMFFVSPSGNGIKVFVKVDSDESLHDQAFRQIAAYFNYEYDISEYGSLDMSVRDISRACFMSSDPDAYYSDNTDVWSYDSEYVQDTYNEKIGQVHITDESSISSFYNYLSINTIDITAQYENWTALGTCLLNIMERVDAEKWFLKFSSLHSEFNEAKTKEKLLSLEKTNQERKDKGLLCFGFTKLRKMAEAVGFKGLKVERKKNWRNVISDEQFQVLLNGSEFSEADVFYRLYPEIFAFDHKTKEWYQFVNGYWKLDEMTNIYTTIAHTFISVYDEFICHYEKIEADMKVIPDMSSRQEEELKSISNTIALIRKKRREMKSITKAKKIAETLSIGRIKGDRNSYGVNIRGYYGISGDEWDRQHTKIATRDGKLVDMETGQCTDMRPSDYIRSIANAEWRGLYEPCPVFEHFISEIMQEEGNDNKYVSEFLQRFFGYACSGMIIEHVIMIMYGEEGRNGKDTLLETIGYVMGKDLAAPINEELIRAKNGTYGGPSPAKYTLMGLRLGWISETSENGMLDLQAVKQLTGGGQIRCRKLYGNEIVFDPTHQLVVATNHKPIISSDDRALWKRMISVPFNVVYCENPQKDNERKIDKFMLDKLKKESSGILAWIVRGYMEWRRFGSLLVPPAIENDKEEYRKDQDSVISFIEEMCEVTENLDLRMPLSTLKDRYKYWCIENGRKIVDRGFQKRLEREFPGRVARNNGNRYIRGINLINF